MVFKKKKEMISKSIGKLMKKNYESIENPGSFGGVKRLYDASKTKNKEIQIFDVKKYLSEQDEYTLHKPVRKIFKRNKVTVSGIDDTWQMDLVDMSAFKNENKNITFILTVIDVFSKFAWGRMLQNKTGLTVLEAIKSIIKNSKRKPKNLHTDQGSEFFNKHCKKYFIEENINHYFTYSGLKASICERFNRTLKDRMWRHFTFAKNNKYYDVFEKFFVSYNSSYHRSIKMSPQSVNKSNSDSVFFNLYGYDKNEGNFDKDVKLNLKEGDFVRMSKYKGIFSKGYERNWTTEVVEVFKINFNNRIPVFICRDLSGEILEGVFYDEELQKVTINIRELERRGEFTVNKILDTRTRKGKKEYFVSWLYYPQSANSWISEGNWNKKNL
jgi:hypothetical protein